MQDKPLLTIYNNHREEAPRLVVKPKRDEYYGYFENEHSEQWVFIYDYTTETAVLRGGDAGWSNTYPILDDGSVELILNPSEQTWLRACWESATAFKAYRQHRQTKS